MIQNIVTKICNKTPYLGINPLVGAVQGAALEGAVASGIENLHLSWIPTTLMSIGIQAENKFVPIIRRNSRLPARETLSFLTLNSDQTEAMIIVYKGNEKDAKKNHLLGQFKITGLPMVPNMGQKRGSLIIHVCIDVDISNAMKVLTKLILMGLPIHDVFPMEVKMPNFDGGHGLCAKMLSQSDSSKLDLVCYDLPKYGWYFSYVSYIS
ncbi:Hypothetical predicted protein [Olea europaea subsp. europaea]|uniref:Uncharacterized protein n=1 Tax=Olea europaea subsp. europaea TaxID=158383 RepID=A0A8S0P7V6_OLEEU|nr:Hypothetical predicted protein [Olea europaea subsp. europaea]